MDSDLGSRCDLAVVDLATGDMTGRVRIARAFDVAFLPRARRPSAIGFKTDEVNRVISIEEDAG